METDERTSASLATSDPQLVGLRDGSWVTVRPVGPEDEPALRSFMAGLDLEARYLRFFSGAADTSAAARAAAMTGPERFGLVAHDETGMLVGHALYIQIDRRRAEVAVEIAEHLRDRGLATILIERLGVVAEQHGITRFVAEVLPENHPMLGVFRDGFDARIALCDGVEHVELPTSAWRTARARFPEPAHAEQR